MSNREEFVKWFESRYIDDIHPDSTIGIASWETWQARVPEGYVVVPKEPSAELVNHGHQVFLGHFNEGGQTGGRSLYFAYKAMLEAVEK